MKARCSLFAAALWWGSLSAIGFLAVPMLFRVLPSAAVGIALGYALAAFVKPGAVELAVGAVAIVFALLRLWAERSSAPARAPQVERVPWRGVVAGVAAGFTSQIAHAGGPPLMFYLLPLKLDRMTFTSTTVYFFGIINLIKLPFFAVLGLLSADNLAISAALAPVALIGVVMTLLGLAGLISSSVMAKGRRYAIVAVVVVAAVVTPPDPISQLMLAVPMVLLYEVSIWCVRIIELRRKKADAD